MAKELTVRQKQVLGCIADYAKENRYMPTLSELGQRLGMSNRNQSPIAAVSPLEKKGYLVRPARKARAMTFTELVTNEIITESVKAWTELKHELATR